MNMTQDQLTAVGIELKATANFEWLCVGGNKTQESLNATYMVNQRIGDDIDVERAPLFYRTVSLLTGKTLDLFVHPSLSADAARALTEHFNEKFVHADAIDEMMNMVNDHDLYLNSEGKCNMPISTVFGKSVYHGDLGEVMVQGGAWASVF